MKYLYKITGSFDLENADTFIANFGITLLAFVSMPLYTVLAVFYLLVSYSFLALICFFQVILSLAAYLTAKKINIYVAFSLYFLTVAVSFVSETLYFGNGGTILSAVILLLSSNLFVSRSRKKTITTLDIAVTLCSVIFFIAANRITVNDTHFTNGNYFTLIKTVITLTHFIYIGFILWLNSVAQSLIKEHNKKLMRINEKAANYDSLTELGNRRLYKQNESELEEKIRSGEFTIAAVMLDIDHFKKVNDKYGHDAGDDVLQFLAKKMTSAFRQGDILIRWGGEEFLLMLKNMNLPNCYRIMETFRKNIENSPIAIKEGEISITITAGICVADKNTTLSSAISVADERLYFGKRTTRNCIVYKDDMSF